MFTALKNGFEAGDILKELSKGDTAVIFITEQLAAELEETLKKLKTRPYPAVIPIPSAAGSNGFGLSGVKKMSKRPSAWIFYLIRIDYYVFI